MRAGACMQRSCARPSRAWLVHAMHACIGKLRSLTAALLCACSGSIPACITHLPELVELHLDFNQLTGTLPAFATANSPLVYFSAAFQARPPLDHIFRSIVSWQPERPSSKHTRQVASALWSLLTDALFSTVGWVGQGPMMGLACDGKGQLWSLVPLMGEVPQDQAIWLEWPACTHFAGRWVACVRGARTHGVQVGFLSGLSGSLPGSLGRLEALTYLDLGGNILSGVLPPALPASLVDLRLADNALTGSIPASYGARCGAHAM